MTEANSFLVPWTPTVIPAGCEPYPQGGTWAEPDREAAARLMHTVFADKELGAARGRQGAEDLRTLHSPEAAGRVISARLAELASARLAELEDERHSRKRRGTRDQISAIARRIRRPRTR